MQKPDSHFLSQTERDSLKASHRLERDKRKCDRIKAILMLDRGLSYEEIEEHLLLEEDTIKRYFSLYREGGEKALLSTYYMGKSCLLTKEELQEVEEFVEKNTPQSATAVVEFVRKEFGKEYTVSAIVALLHRLGFIYKKPKLVPGKADPEKQEQFLKEIQQIQEELGEEDVLFYADGVHPQHNTKAAYGWFRRGDKQQLPANSGRERMNINGALNAKDLSIAIDISNAVNSQSTIHLLQGIERKYLNAKRIVIVCDNAPYNRSKMVKEFLKGTRIEMKFLPPYSPNLNLIERVWRFMNKKVRDNKYYEKFEEFKEAILDFFKNFSAFEAELMSLLVNKFRIIRV
jgi:transposase